MPIIRLWSALYPISIFDVRSTPAIPHGSGQTMIIARSPLRISLGGGGTDLPSYYQEHTGFLVAAAIDRHVHIVINRTILPELILKYSQTERVTDVKDIHHPLVREAMLSTG